MPGGDLLWSIYNLVEASDGSVWAGARWGALRLDREGPTLYTTEAFATALRNLTSGLRLSIVPDEAASGRR